jgi:hypothetical protein
LSGLCRHWLAAPVGRLPSVPTYSSLPNAPVTRSGSCYPNRVEEQFCLRTRRYQANDLRIPAAGQMPTSGRSFFDSAINACPCHVDFSKVQEALGQSSYQVMSNVEIILVLSWIIAYKASFWWFRTFWKRWVFWAAIISAIGAYRGPGLVVLVLILLVICQMGRARYLLLKRLSDAVWSNPKWRAFWLEKPSKSPPPIPKIR